jgi:hypothetical protein
MCSSWFISCKNKNGTALVGDIGYTHVGAVDGNLSAAARFCCESKVVLKVF